MSQNLNAKYLGHSLPDLVAKYRNEPSVEIEEYVTQVFGINGLYKLSIKLAITYVIHLLENDISTLLWILENNTGEEVDCAYYLLYDVFRNDVEDCTIDRYEAWETLMKEINLYNHHSNKNLEYAHKFIKSISQLISDTYKEEPSSEYDFILESISMNPTIKTQDIYTWAYSPDLGRIYFSILGNKFQQDVLHSKMYANNSWVGGHLRFSTDYIVFALEKFYNRLMVDTTGDVVYTLNYITDAVIQFWENMKNDTSSITGDLFLYGNVTVLPDDIVCLLRLFWGVWWKEFSPVIKEWYQRLYDEGEGLSYDDIQHYREEVIAGGNNAIIYACYYSGHYLYKQSIFDTNFISNEKEYIDRMNILISSELLPAEFFTNLEVFEKMLGEYFKDIPYFSNTASSVEKVEKVPTNELLNYLD